MKAPAASTEKNILYPKIPEIQLNNGLRVLVIQDDRLPRVFISLVFPVGRVFNPNDNLSLVSLAIELLKSGTETRSARDISDLMDQLAIQYESDVLMEHSFISMSFLEEQLEPALELLADVLSGAIFPKDELEKLQVRWKSHLIAQRSQPNFLANECTLKTFYRDHPYSKVSMTPEHLDKATQDSVRNIYQSHFSPHDAYLLLAGPVDPVRATELGNHFLGGWENQKKPSMGYPEPTAITSRRVCLVHRPHSVQSQLLLAGRTLPPADPHVIALKVTNQVLGGGASARLFLNLREDKGYTYGAYSRLKSYISDGLFMAGASVKTEVTLECIKEILKELRQLREEPPEEKELARCQQELIGSFIRQMETPASVGTLELDRRIFHQPEDFYSTFIPKVREITAETVVKTARRFFDPERLVITVVADRERVENELRQLGELRVYDINGKPI
ncbi:insulinase family protein [Acidobacteria bacterium AH-259-D05]|nr:insulinase family protein [Acidobacteria bacterium AH-259-D05]